MTTTSGETSSTDGGAYGGSRPDTPATTTEEPASAGAPRSRLLPAARLCLPPLALYGAAKLVGLGVFAWLLEYAGDYRGKDPRFGGGAHWWDVLASWDGWWYLQIAENGYRPEPLKPLAPGGQFTAEQNSVAFFPLYPTLIRTVSDITGLSLYGSAILVSVLCSFIAAAGIYAAISLLAGARAGTIAAGLWAVAPAAGVEWAVYSESLFVAIAVWTCYAVLKRRWVAAGLLAFLSGLSRPTAAALIGAVGLAALVTVLRRDGRRQQGVTAPLYALVAAPLGLLSYVLWVGHSMGDLTAYFALQREAWAHYFDFGSYTLDVLRNVAVGHSGYLFAYPVPDLVAVQIVVALPFLVVLMLRKRPPLVLTAFTLATIVSILGTQQMFGNTPRHLLPLFPLLLAPAATMSRLKWPGLAVFFTTTAVASGWYAHYLIFELGIP